MDETAARDGHGTRRLTSPHMIGRAAELHELEAALADATGGASSVVLVSGEAGVGKTRLVGEFHLRAQDRGALVLTGDAIDLGGESSLPYLPLIAALRPLARAGDPVLTAALRDAVHPLLPGLAAPVPARHAEVPESGQQRLFEGLLALLDALATDRPVVLTVEDLHWADPSTRMALSFLARSLSTERVLLAGTYRSDELHRRHPLRPWLAELERDSRTRRIALRPFTPSELAEQVGAIRGAAASEELVQRLWTRSGGNPLFGEELLAVERDGDGEFPDSLRSALMLRVERLSGAAQAVLRLVAAAGRLDHAALEEASPLDRDVVRDALREAVDRKVLVAQADEPYRFRHELLREVVADDLLPGERSDLHLSLARALEHRVEEGSDAAGMAAVAHHFVAAGDATEALRSSARAATAAENAHAHGEALTLLEQALDLWDRVPDAETLAGADRVAMLIRASDAASALGRPDRQLALLELALERVEARRDPVHAASILVAIARAQRHRNRAQESIATLQRARALVDDDGAASVPPIRAAVLAALARALMIAGRYADAAELARKALRAAGEAGLPLSEGDARNTLGFSMAMTGAVDDGVTELRAAMRIAREQANRADLALAHLNLADLLHGLGRSAEALDVAEEGRRAVEDVLPVAVTWLDATTAELAFDIGEWERAEGCLPAVQPWTGEQTRASLLLRRAALAAGRGETAAADELIAELEPLAAKSCEPRLVGPFAVLIAEVRCREGDFNAARAAVARGLERIASCGDDPARAAAVAAAGVTVEADAAERARDVRDEATAAAARSHLDRLLRLVATAATPARPVERATLLSARAEASRAAGSPDPVAYAEAAAAWREVGRAEPAARMLWRQGEALALVGDRDAATACAARAHEVAERLGAGWLQAAVEALVARARLRIDGHDRGEQSPQPHEDEFGLTPRERDVLALLAEGATNREIGATLFMAEKTASVHVSRILTKLNARSRTEAAAVAHRHGLVDRQAQR